MALCCEAVQQGFSVLQSDAGSAVDAVVKAVMCLEDNPLTNAGYGSCLSGDGSVECDASVMDGHVSLSIFFSKPMYH